MLLEAYNRLPLAFEQNLGQADATVKFLVRGNGYTASLRATDAVIAFTPSGTAAGVGGLGAALRLRLPRANAGARMIGLDALPGKRNYFLSNDPSNWHTNVPTYAKVEYEEVYPGTDLIYHGNDRQLECDFVLAPGSNLKRIRLHFDRAERVELDMHGDLVVHVDGKQIRLRKPVLYQEPQGERREVEGGYVLEAKNEVGFQAKTFDRRIPLVIDPVLVYSTYLGGADFSGLGTAASTIAVDAAGDTFVAGLTTGTNFPITRGAFQSSSPGLNQAVGFITKFNPAGTALIYSTYFNVPIAAIAIDSAGNAYLTGAAGGSNFPTTAGAPQAKSRNLSGSSAFVTKLNPTGSGLVYSTYLGGSGGDSGAAIAVDSGGHSYVTGWTRSTDFPTTNGALQTAFSGTPAPNTGGPTGAFLTELSADGSALVYSTYLGAYDFAESIAVDQGGNAYVFGGVSGLFGPVPPVTFPTTPGVFTPACSDLPSGAGGFLAKINPSGTAFIYSTALNCAYVSMVQPMGGIAVDASGNAYVAGFTNSRDLPVTPGAFQGDNLRGTFKGFIFKFNPAATALLYATYVGGTTEDDVSGVAVDSAGRAFITGHTISTDFPVTPDAFQRKLPVAGSAFVTELNTAGTALAFSTYLGGAVLFGGGSTDYRNGTSGTGVAVDSVGNVYITGQTDTSDFPTMDPFQPTLTGQSNAFVSKIGFSGPSVNAGGVVNAANFRNLPLAAGSIASVFGNEFAPASLEAASQPLPVMLSGAAVQINGSPAPLFAVTPQQINFQVPWEVVGQSQVSLVVNASGVSSNSGTISLADVSPGLFSTNQQGTGQGAILIGGTGILAAPVGAFPGSRPAGRGEFISIFCTGLGRVANQPASGAAAPAVPPSTTPTLPDVSIGGVSSTAAFSGLAPGYVGLYQVNVQVPQNAPTGNAVPLVLTMAGAVSNAVTIAVQ